MPIVSLPMLPEHVSALDRIMLTIAIGLRIELSGVMSLGKLILSLSCNNPAARPTPNPSVSSYGGSFSS